MRARSTKKQVAAVIMLIAVIVAIGWIAIGFVQPAALDTTDREKVQEQQRIERLRSLDYLR